MSKKYTAEEKAAYFAGLRAKWREAQRLAAADDQVGAIYHQLAEMGLPDVSMANVCLILQQAQALGLPGLPYVDFKTYEHWRQAGYQVRKGEHSQVFSITWIAKSDKNDESQQENKTRWPKVTNLFHVSQVDPIPQGYTPSGITS